MTDRPALDSRPLGVILVNGLLPRPMAGPPEVTGACPAGAPVNWLGLARSSEEALTELEALLTGQGHVVRRPGIAPAGNGAGALPETFWEHARSKLESASHQLELATGTAACVVGVGLGGLLALELALDGRIAAVVAWQPDLGLPKELDSAWRAARGCFEFQELAGEAVGRPTPGATGTGWELPGDYAEIQCLRREIEHLRSRVLPVPGLVVSDLDDVRAVDPRWFGARTQRNLWLTVASGGNVVRPDGENAWGRTDTLRATADWLNRLPRAEASRRRADGRLVEPATDPGDRRGSVFISYRHGAEGSRRAAHIASYLQAAGLRVFLDKKQMEPDDIVALIDRAIADDCSGGVIVATPDIGHSDFVQRQELPRLLAHAERHGMRIAVDNAIRGTDDPGRIDVRKPLDLLGLPQETLDNFTQYDMMGVEHAANAHPGLPVTENYGIDSYIEHLLRSRMEPLRNHPVYLDIHTYPGLGSDIPDNREADLRIRLCLPGYPGAECHRERVAALRRLKLTLRSIGEALHAAGPERVIVTGGAHQSIALALGGMLSERRLACPVIVEDRYGAWGLPNDHDPQVFRVSEPVTVDEGEWDPSAQTVAVLVAGPQTDSRMFTDFVAKLRTPIARAAIIEAFDPNRPGDPTATIDAREGTRLATRIAAEVTGLAGGPGSEILLCHALSFPLAVLLGRLLNKYRIVCYEAIGKQWYQRLCALSQSDAQIDCVYDDPWQPGVPTKFW
mgnify:FL=1